MSLEWDKYLAMDEKVETSFTHKKKKLYTVLGVTDKRAFLYQKRRTQEKFVSSKLNIVTIEYNYREIPPAVYAVLFLLVIMGIIATTMISYVGGPILGISLLMLIIAVLLRRLGTISTYIGGTFVLLTSRKKMDEIIEFIRIVHSKQSIHSSGITPGGSQFNPKQFGKVLVRLVILLLFIGAIVAIVIMSSSYYYSPYGY